MTHNILRQMMQTEQLNSTNHLCLQVEPKKLKFSLILILFLDSSQLVSFRLSIFARQDSNNNKNNNNNHS